MRIWCRENIIVKKSFYLTFCMPWKICGEIWGNMFFWLFSNFGPQTLMMCRNFYTNQPKMTKCLNDFLHQMILKKKCTKRVVVPIIYFLLKTFEFWLNCINLVSILNWLIVKFVLTYCISGGITPDTLVPFFLEKKGGIWSKFFY